MIDIEVIIMWKKIKPYVISVLIALGIGALSALLTRNSMDMYKNIVQPPLSPPMAMFPVVWSILFILMGIGSAIIWIKRDTAPETASAALKVYGIQLVVNFFWSIIFFNMQAYLFAFIWLMILWLMIIWMIILFRKVSPAAAWMQAPYLLWVTFAAYLNLAVYILNR